MTFILGTNPFLDSDFDSPAENGNLEEPHTNRKRRNAILNDDFLWPEATIPYEISSIFNGRIMLICMHVSFYVFVVAMSRT